MDTPAHQPIAKAIGGALVTIAVAILLYGAFSRQSSAPEKDRFFACTEDSDCVLVKGNACGCTAGGTAAAVNVHYQTEWLSQFSLNTICPQIISHDPTCFQTPHCIQNRCTLQ